MGFTAAVLIGSALIGAGVDEGIHAFSGGKKESSPNLPALPTPPDPNAAAQQADTAQTRQRQILLASGGQTDYTGGTGTLLGSDVGKATLLGG